MYILRKEEQIKMLNLIIKKGDTLQIGENVKIKLQNDSRAQLAIDAPREVSIKRIVTQKEQKENKLGK